MILIKDTIFISLDQSTKDTGWCVWTNGEYTLSGLIDNSKIKDMNTRFNSMVMDIFSLFDKYKPHVVSIEDTALQKNVKTLKELSQLQGVLIGYCKLNDIDIQIVSPSEWRSQLGFKTGKGIKRPELKKQCMEWVKNNLGIEKSEDEIEAIGIGAAVLKMWRDRCRP